MRIGLDNMDPSVAKAIADKLCGTREPFISPDIEWGKPKRRDFVDEDAEAKPRKKRQSTAEENYTLLLRKRRDDNVAKRTLYAAVPSLLMGAGTTVGLMTALQSTEYRPIAAAAGLVVSIIGICAGRSWANQASQLNALKYEVLREELRTALPHLSLSRAERVYCDILVMLVDFEANQEARTSIRKTMVQLNELLADSRRLDKQRKSLLPALGTSPVKELTAEQQKLEKRIAEASDEITQGSLSQSLEHMKDRIDNSKNLEQAIARLNAQQEAIINALASSQGALARMQVAPSIQADNAIQQIKETVEEMNRETIAVEEAVQEVLMLR